MAAFTTFATTATASDVQKIQTFQNAQVTVPYGTTAGGAADIFCTVRGFSDASDYDLAGFVATAAGADGTAVFSSVSCRAYLPAGATDGVIAAR